MRHLGAAWLGHVHIAPLAAGVEGALLVVHLLLGGLDQVGNGLDIAFTLDAYRYVVVVLLEVGSQVLTALSQFGLIPIECRYVL